MIKEDLPKSSQEPVWRQLAPWVSGVLTLAMVILVALHFSTLEKFTTLARQGRADWLLVAGLTQAATYVCAAAVWREALRHAWHPRSLRVLVPLGIAKLFTDQVIPSSGVSGAILVARALTRRGVPTRIAMAVLLVGLVSYFAAYLVCVLTSVVILWLHGRGSFALSVSVAIFAIVIIGIPSAVLWMQSKAHLVPPSWVGWVPGARLLLRDIAAAPTDLLRDPVLLGETVALEATIFALDALTLWLAFCVFGAAPLIWVAFVSFIMASMAATLVPIPLGLGSFEAACVGMLTLLGVAIEAALAATLLLRGLTFWLPMIPGLWLARREILP